MKLGIAAPYDIKNPLSWSGTPLSLWSALKCLNAAEVDCIDLSAKHTWGNQRLNYIKTTDFKASVRQKTRVSKFGISEMNPLNSRLLENHCDHNKYDALLEFGGYRTEKELPPYFIYSDSTHDMALDYFEKFGVLPHPYKAGDLDMVKRAADYCRSMYLRAEGVFCMSRWMAENLVRITGVDARKVHTVYAAANWHNTDTRELFRPKSIRGKNTINIILVGVDFFGKGVDIVLKALELLNNEGPMEYYFHVAGINASHPELSGNPYVINHGFIEKPQLLKLLIESDLFVLPSRFDYFGIAFIEAMSCGLPCIGRNRCAMPEITDAGINGELVNNDDALKLAALIDGICSDEEKYMRYSENAVIKAKTFDWTNTAKSMIEMINKT